MRSSAAMPSTGRTHDHGLSATTGMRWADRFRDADVHLTHAEIDVRALPNASSTILGPSYSPTATSECLRLRRAPPDACTDEWTSDGCLRSALPLRIPHAAVEACFRCCVLNATAPLRANAAFWRRAWLAESRDPWGKDAAGKARGVDRLGIAGRREGSSHAPTATSEGVAPRLAAAMLYDGGQRWHADLAHVVATFKDEAVDATHARVWSQSQLQNLTGWRWHRDHNHDFDNVPLQLVRIANATLQFDWLIVSDGDTCVDVGALKLALSVHDPQRLLFLGHPMRDGFKCVQTRTCCTGRHRRCDHGDRRDYYARNLSRPNQWPLGGAGYVLSRALLHSISASQWAACERGIRRNGGDVRVASCVWSHTRVGLGWLPGLLGNASRHPAVC